MSTSTPSLIVGLGGSGLKVATYVKKNVLEMYGNRLPAGFAIQVLDTEKEIKWYADGWGQERGEERSTGPIKIDMGEYIALTGNVKAVVEAIKQEQKQISGDPSHERNMPYRHISPWFQARYYLDTANVTERVWNLEEGAARYRQFGRLGLFTNINDVVRRLRDSVQAVYRSTQGRTLYVHVVGSLAGGTGAALFTDIAHLVQRIASEIGYQQTPTFGHFILANAFRGTPQIHLNESGVLRYFNARMYAALRELTRLQSPVVARSGGYPLTYAPLEKGELNSLLPGKLYDAVYLYDGVGERIRLDNFGLEKGLAPSIADVITAYTDEASGGAFRSHSVNYNAFYSAYNIPTGAVTYGTVGTYTIELPIYHITEGWAYKLAQDVLDTLLKPDNGSRDRKTEVPAGLVPNEPGGRKLEPTSAVETWVLNETSSLVARMVEWGQQAGRNDVVKQQTVNALLALTAEGWFRDLAPSDPLYQDYIADARAELDGSLADKANPKYYAATNRPGGSNEQQAVDLRVAVDESLRLMVGDSVDIWQRTGGDFRGALVRLGNHHVLEFEKSLIKAVKEYLNGADVGTASDQKSAKLGFVVAFLGYLEQLLAASAQTMALAEQRSQFMRRPPFDVLDRERKKLFTDLQKGAGFLGRTANKYREKSDELAQFHKADIARKVVHDLAERLHRSANQLLTEAQLWQRVLATGSASHGGVYGLLKRGQKEIEWDRQQSESAVRWVIKDNEKGDTYINDKYTRYVEGDGGEDNAHEKILSQIEWRVDKVAETGDLRIDFAFTGEQPWSRVAGKMGEEPAGLRNLTQLLNRCRAPFGDAWTDMSVTAYLYQNFYENGSRVQELAERIHKNSDYPLEMVSTNSAGPTMRTAFMRVYREDFNESRLLFLRELQKAVARMTGETLRPRQALYKVADTDGGGEYRNEIGEPSLDRFKISFLLYGDLLLPEQIAGFEHGQAGYHRFSGAGSQWRELQVLPAETHALEIERELEKGGQRRREFDPEVVTVMEKMDSFRVAMRCLAYGETDYDWGIGSKTGLLLNRYTPHEDNPNGLSFWRLVLLPEGTQTADGRIIDAYGQIAEPLEYQLSDLELEPSLLEAFIQLVSLQKDTITGNTIDWSRVEATVKHAMNQHSGIWRERGEIGWQLLDGRPNRPIGEMGDKAAQTVRLNALIAWIEEQHGENAWAWSKGEQYPRSKIALDRERLAAIRRGIDLLMAIRGVAQQELLAVHQRLQQIAVQTGVTPTESVSFGAWGAAVWICSNDHVNMIDKEYCVVCGNRRPILGSHAPPETEYSQSTTEDALPKDVWPFIDVEVTPIRPKIYDPVVVQCTVATSDLVSAGTVGELLILPEVMGFQLQENNPSESFLLSENSPARMTWVLRLIPTSPGRQQITLRPFINGTALPEKAIRVYVKAPPKPIYSLLESPISQADPAADLVLRAYTTPAKNAKEYKIEYVAFSPRGDLNLLGQPVGEVNLAIPDLQRVRERLAEALRQSSREDRQQALQTLAGIGHSLYDLLFSPELQKLYAKINKSLVSILIISDLDPWIPWELVRPRQSSTFLGQAHAIGRWIEGQGALRRTSFPVGQVAVAFDSSTKRQIKPAELTKLFVPGEVPRFKGLPFVDEEGAFLDTFDYASPTWGLHLATGDQSAKGEPTSMAVQVPDLVAPEPVRSHILELRRKQPLVTIGCLRPKQTAPKFSNVESRWMPTFVRSGATAVVGPLWTTTVSSDRLFWKRFYEAVWDKNPLGESVRLARNALAAANPKSHDWLAYFLVGDPVARGYVPEQASAYATVECLDYDLSRPLRSDETYHLTATLRSLPPDWDRGRRLKIATEAWDSPRITVFAPSLDIDPATEVALSQANDSLMTADFTVTPRKQGAHELHVQFVSGTDEVRHTLSLEFQVGEKL